MSMSKSCEVYEVYDVGHPTNPTKTVEWDDEGEAGKAGKEGEEGEEGEEPAGRVGLVGLVEPRLPNTMQEGVVDLWRAYSKGRSSCAAKEHPGHTAHVGHIEHIWQQGRVSPLAEALLCSILSLSSLLHRHKKGRN